MATCIPFKFAEEFQRLRSGGDICSGRICTVDTYADLPLDGNEPGDIRIVIDQIGSSQSVYIWDETHNIWIPVCGPWGDPVDIKPADRVAIDSMSYTLVVSYGIPSGKTFRLHHISVNVLGFSSEFRIEYFDGMALTLLRSYVLNTQETMESEDLEIPIELASGTGAYVRVVAKTMGVNQSGSAFASLNGTLV